MGKNISRRIRSKGKVENVGPICNTVRNMSRVLLQVMEDSKVEGQLTRMVSEGRGKPKLVVNIEVSKNGDLHKRKESQNVLHFRSYVVKEFSIIRGVRREIYSTEKFSYRVNLKSKPGDGKLRRFKCGHESKLSRCRHRCNIQLWNENEDRESRREQRRDYCQLLQTPVFW